MAEVNLNSYFSCISVYVPDTKHKSFSNSKNKLRTLWNITDDTKQKLKNKKNTSGGGGNYNKKLKNEDYIYDSGWLALQPQQASPSRTTTIKDELVPVIADFEHGADFEIDSRLLPYINWSLLVKAPPNTEVYSFYEDTTHPFGGNYIEVKSGSTEIYTGSAPGDQSKPSRVFTQDDIDADLINGSFTKKVFYTEIEYTSGGTQYKVEGNLLNLELRLDQGLACINGSLEEFRNYNWYYCGCAKAEVDLALDTRGDQKFNDVSASSINADWRLVETIWSKAGVDCLPTNYTTQGHNATVSFPAVDGNPFDASVAYDQKYVLEDGARFEKVGGDWVTVPPTGAEVFGYYDLEAGQVSGINVTKRYFKEIGFWLFYSIEDDIRIWFSSFPLTDTGTCREDENTIQLAQPTNYRWTTPPYSSVELNVNPTGYPEIIERIQEENTEGDQKIFFRLSSEGVNPARYRLLYESSLLIITPASKLRLTDIERYESEYNAVLNAGFYKYEFDSVACADTEEDTFIANVEDFEVRLIGKMSNTLYWTEQKRVKDGNP